MHQITNQFIRSLIQINLRKKIYSSRKFILKNFSKLIFFFLYASYSIHYKLKESIISMQYLNILINDIKIVLIFNFIYIYI